MASYRRDGTQDDPIVVSEDDGDDETSDVSMTTARDKGKGVLSSAVRPADPNDAGPSSSTRTSGEDLVGGVSLAVEPLAGEAVDLPRQPSLPSLPSLPTLPSLPSLPPQSSRQPSPPLPPLPPLSPLSLPLPPLPVSVSSLSADPPLPPPPLLPPPFPLSSASSATSRSSDWAAVPPPPRPRPAARPPPQPPRNTMQDLVLPRWQPDAEATYCPICHTQFSMFVRKHHCRKCGRVVCNSCSPHRITIPYQFIVRPPGQYAFGGVPSVAAATLLGDGSGGFAGASSAALVDVSTLGGGERVRLCNPCVPDPNTTPPVRGHSRSVSSASSVGLVQGSALPPPPPPPSSAHASHSAFSAFSSFLPYSSSSPNVPYLPSAQGLASGSGSTLTVAANRQHRMSMPPAAGSAYPYFSQTRPFQQPRPAHPGYPQGGAYHQHASPHRPAAGAGAGAPDYRNPPYYPAPRARPVLAEEDECPVCHEELPSRQLPDFETRREQHIIDCLERNTAGHHRSQGQSPTRAQSSSPGAGAHAPAADGASGDGSSSAGPTYRRLTGMFPYTATEKDCVDAAECTICLEEFVAGVAMGRLECLCRFHRACISAWFEKHPGCCPVHNHDSADY